MLTRLWSFLSGYVSLVVEGKSLEKLINMAVTRGLYLWDVKWIDSDKVRVKVRLNGIRALRHIARRTHSRFSIAGKQGLPFHVARMRKRKTFLAGAVLTVMLVYLMSNFVWFVEVKGNKQLSAAVVVSAAEEAGLGMGTFKAGLDKDLIEKHIRNQVPQVAWVGIRITGTRAVIEIAEKTIIPPPDTSPANVVAGKDGLVQEMLVLSGKPLVNEGEMVKQGDILITGEIIPEPKPEQDLLPGATPPPPEPIRLVRAKGIVRAKVWYAGYGECRLIDSGTKRTGRQVQIISLHIMGKELVLKGPRKQPYRDFVTSSQVKTIPQWRNLNLPVEVVTTNYYEVEKYRDIIGMSNAKARALSRALTSARSKIPDGVRVTREISEEIRARDSNIVRVKVVLEVIEDIGIVEPIISRE